MNGEEGGERYGEFRRTGIFPPSEFGRAAATLVVQTHPSPVLSPGPTQEDNMSRIDVGSAKAALGNTEHLREDLDVIRTDLAQLKADLKDVARDTLNVARSGAAQARERVGQAVDAAKEKGKEAVHAAAEQGKEAVQKVEKKIGDNPLMSVGIAFGAGLLIGALLSRR